MTSHGPSAPALTYLCTLLLATALLAGCAFDSSPVGVSPSPGLTESTVTCSYTYRPGGWIDGETTRAYVHVSSTGLTDLTVAINGHALLFDDEMGMYMGNPPEILPEDTASFSVTDGQDSVAVSVVVPYPPTDLSLDSEPWDATEATACNTLRWDLHDEPADRLYLTIWEWDEESLGRILRSGNLDSASSTEAVVCGQDLLLQPESPEVFCILNRINEVVVPDQTYACSALAGGMTQAIWPVALSAPSLSRSRKGGSQASERAAGRMGRQPN